MSEANETPIVNDAITSDDAGFNSDVGDQAFDETVEMSSEETSEESIDESGEGSEETVQAETKEELKQEIEDAIEDGASEEQVADMIKEYTLKVNGKEKTVKLDLNNEEDIIRRLQMAEVGQSSMQKAKELEKAYNNDLKRLMADPFGTLEELGHDPLKLAEERIRAEIEERKKSPDLRERERIEKELSKAREELQRQKEEANNARMAQLEAQEAAKLEAEIDIALDAHPKLPKSQRTVTRIADHLLWAIENAEDMGLEPNDITVEDVIPSVEQEMLKELQEFMSELPEEVMEEYIGQKNLERLRKRRLNTMKTNNVSSVKPTTKSVKPEEKPSGKKRVKAKDYFKNL